MKVSEYIVKFFENEGVKDIFMLTGGGCMHMVDSFGSSEKIKYYCPHHEQSAAIAAEGYAKFKTDLGLVLVTSGPGATNVITGLLGAYQDSTPCIFLSGQAKRKQTVYNSGIKKLRQLGVQEVNIIPVVESLTKYAIMINDPNTIKYHLEKAVFFAKSGRPGPVWLDIPLDVQSAKINENELISFSEEEVKKNYKEEPTSKEMNLFLKELINAKRPVIIAGQGIRLSSANDLFKKFVEKYKIPVVTPIMGIDNLETDNICNIGRIGTKGTRAGNIVMQNADLVISLGSRLSVSVTGHEYSLFAKESKKIVIDIDKNEHQKKTIEIDKFINADIKKFLEKMLENDLLKNVKTFNSWLDKCNFLKNKYPVCLKEYNEDKNGINYYKMIDIITKNTENNTPLISDAGSAFYVVSQACNLKKGQRYITSGAIATMGFSLPAGIGVCIANDKKNTVAITGDGSLQQNIQELAVLKTHNLPLKLFVANNKGYLSIRQTQKKFFNGNLVGESENSGIFFPDLSLIARAYGIDYIKIETIKDLETNIRNILLLEKPILIEVKVLENQEIIPTVSTKIQSDGTMVSMPLDDMYPFLEREEFLENIKNIKK